MTFIVNARNQLAAQSNDVNGVLQTSNNSILFQRSISSEGNVNTTASNLNKTSTDQVVNESKPVNKAVRIQVAPDPDYKIPVLYGRVSMGGAVTDVCTTNNGQELQICFTLAMLTGNKIDGTPTTYELRNVYWNDQKINFGADGEFAASLTDKEGNVNTDYEDRIAVYVYANSSNIIRPVGFESVPFIDARNVFDTWTVNHEMPSLLFGIVRIAWNPDLGLDAIPDMRFDIQSSMTLPGDVLYDYMQSSIYGIGLDDSLIKKTSL